MELLIVGVNHNTAPIALRERVAFTPEQLGDALTHLTRREQLDELAILCTCNRTELYTIAPENQGKALVSWLAEYQGLHPSDLEDSVYTHAGPGALRHLARVATGLDSMVLGEPQILGQLKDAFNRASQHQTMGRALNRISQYIYHVAKQVRTETNIGQNPVSVASTAVDLARQLFSDLSTCHTLLVGAGETTELVATHLRSAGVHKITIANRTLENARTLADKLNGEAATLNDLPGHLAKADIVVAATASQLPIIGKGMAESAIKARRHKPIFMVDLAVPRDIESEVNDLRDVYLYSIDDLQQIIDSNLSNRQEAAGEAEKIIEEAIRVFSVEGKGLGAVDTLVKFRTHHDAIKLTELNKALQRLENGADPADIINTLANQLTNKIVHTPSVQIKQAKIDGRDDILAAIESLYQLNGDSPHNS